jgi:hypothetical protein
MNGMLMKWWPRIQRLDLQVSHKEGRMNEEPYVHPRYPH